MIGVRGALLDVFFLLGLVSPGLALLAPIQSGPIEREARIRALALGEGDQQERLEELLVSDSWPERLVALEALARCETSGLLGPVLDEVRACLVYSQPNVRAGAIKALVRAGLAGSLQVDMLRLAGDVHPLVRMAAARCDLPGVLAVLVGDSDPQVAAVARWRLMVAGPEAWEQQLDAVLWGTVDLVSVLEPLALGGVSPQLAQALRASDHPEKVLIEGLCASSGLDPDIHVLLAGFCEGIESRRVLLQRREVARLLGAREDSELGRALGVGLLERARSIDLDGDVEDQLDLLLEGAALCLSPREAALLGRELDDERALILWQTLGGRRHRWRAADLAPWLHSERDSALRFDIALFASGQLDGPHGKEWVELFLELVHDQAPGLRLAAFRWLSDAKLDGEQEQALRNRWAGLPQAVRWERLRDLPRNRALPTFRDDLLGLLVAQSSGVTGAIELLSRFRGDAEVSAALEGELASALDQVADASDEERRRTEASATDLLQALARVDPGRGRALARRGLELASEEHPTTRHELGKAALVVLARSEAGRADLVCAMGKGVPRRVQFEAALQGVKHMSEPREFADSLVALFDRVDQVLQLRAVRALESLEGEFLSAHFVQWITDERGQQEVQVAAIEALGQRAALAELAPLLQVASPDLRLAVVDQLCNLEGAGAVLRGEIERRLVGGNAMPKDSFEAAELLDLLRALACHGPLSAQRLELILERPMARAEAELTLRFRGEGLPGILSTWRPELEAFRVLAKNGQGDQVLAAAGEWWRMDARLLYELAHFGAKDRDVSARLLSAARVALMGEQNPRTSLQVRWLRAGMGAGDALVIERHLGQALRALSQSQRGRLQR